MAKTRKYSRDYAAMKQARKSCGAPCAHHLDKIYDEFNTEKVVQHHARAYWRCVSSCYDAALPKQLKKRKSR